MQQESEVACVAITIAKVGYEDHVRRAIAGLFDDVRNERGLIQYDLHVDLDDPRRLIIFERWASREAFDAHVAAPHIKSYLDIAAEWIETLEFYPLAKIG